MYHRVQLYKGKITEEYKFRSLLWQINILIDAGKYDSITVQEVKKHIKAETLPAFFVDRFGKDIDTSLISKEDWLSLSEEWSSFVSAIDEGRKMGVYNKGLCLLLGYALESVQQRIMTERDVT